LNLSVCMASYNGQQYIEQQLASILPQLDEEDEVVVVDDCSSDGTPGLLEGMARADRRIRWFAAERNEGPIRTFEKAILHSRNPVILLSDQDDLWLPTKIETMRSTLAGGHDVVAVLTNAELLVDGERTGRLVFPAGHHPALSVLRQLVRNEFIGCCMAFRRDLIGLLVPFPRTIAMHDWWIGTNALLLGKVVYCALPQVLYRRHGGNVSPGSRRGLPRVLASRLGNVAALVIAVWRHIRHRSHGGRP
jgi:glycosyltransferase involved in cell wall biosynthesis